MYHALSMAHLTSNVVATPVILKYNVSMDHPTSNPVCSHPSNLEIQCTHGFLGRVQHQVCYGSNPSNSGVQCMIIHGSSQRWTLTQQRPQRTRTQCNLILVLDEHKVAITGSKYIVLKYNQSNTTKWLLELGAQIWSVTNTDNTLFTRVQLHFGKFQQTNIMVIYVLQTCLYLKISKV